MSQKATGTSIFEQFY